MDMKMHGQSQFIALSSMKLSFLYHHHWASYHGTIIVASP